MLKYVTPVYLLAIFVGFCITDGPEYAEKISTNPVVLLSVLFILGLLAFLLLMIQIAGTRWVAEGRYKALPADPAQVDSAENNDG